MSGNDILMFLRKTSAIEAIVVQLHDDLNDYSHGDPNLIKVLQAAIATTIKAKSELDADRIRVEVGKHVLVIDVDERGYVGVSLPMGCAAMKSLNRSIARAWKRASRRMAVVA